MAVHSFSPKGQFQGDIQTMALKLDQSQYCARKKYICVKSPYSGTMCGKIVLAARNISVLL